MHGLQIQYFFDSNVVPFFRDELDLSREELLSWNPEQQNWLMSLTQMYFEYPVQHKFVVLQRYVAAVREQCRKVV